MAQAEASPRPGSSRRFSRSIGAHLVVVVVLLLWTFHNARTSAALAHGAGTAATLPADAISIEGPDATGFAIRFPTAMDHSVPLDAKAVHVTPAAALELRWHDERRLVVRTTGLARATGHTLRLGTELRAVDGRRVPDGFERALARRPFVVESCRAAPGDGPRAVVLTMDTAVETKALAAAVRVFGGDGAPCAADISAMLDGAQRATQFRIVGTDAELPADVRVEVAPEFLFGSGGVPPGYIAQPFAVEFGKTLHVTAVRGDDASLRISFSAWLDAAPHDGIRVEPEVPFQVALRDGGISLFGKFTPGAVHRVVLPKGFPGTGRCRLAAETPVHVLVSDREPALAFRDAGTVLSAKADPVVTVTGVNVAGCTVEARRIYANNAVFAAQDPYRQERYAAPTKAIRLPVASARNEPFQIAVPLRDLIGADTRGLHELRLSADELHWHSVRRLVFVTDLGVTMRAAGDSVAVRVTSLALGTPIEGARIRVLTATNQDLVDGRTDANGVALLRFDAHGSDRVPFAVDVRTDDDWCVVDAKSDAVDWSRSGGGRDYATGVEAYVATDRGVARPGETIHATLLIRDAACAVPAGFAAAVNFVDPRGRVRATVPWKDAGGGLAAASFEVPEAGPTGRWAIELNGSDGARLGRAPVTVDMIVPPRIEVAVDAAPARFAERATATVRAKWLEGEPLGRQSGKAFVRFDPASFTPEGYAGWSFDVVRDGVATPGAVPERAFALGDDGVAKVAFDVPAAAGGRQCLRATVVAEVEEPGGRVVRAVARTRMLVDAPIVGIRHHEAGAEIVAVDASGAPVEAGEVVVRLEARRLVHEPVTRANGRYGWQSRLLRTVVAERKVTLGAGPLVVPLEGVIEDGWRTLVVVRDRAEAECDLDVRPSVERFALRGPEGRVVRGAEIELHANVPVAGTVLVTVEGTTVHAAHTFAATIGDNVWRLRLPDVDAPNLHLFATLRARQTGPGPHWIAAHAVVAIDAPTLRGTLELDVAGEVRPETEVTIGVTAHGASAVTLALVDEGVLGIDAHPVPDPYEFFRALRRLATTTADNGPQLMHGAVFDPALTTGGDDGDDGGGRHVGSRNESIRTVAMFHGPVALDPNGRAVVRVTLPPYEGRLRVVAIASGPRAVAANARPLLVKGPLGVRLAMPRVLTPGDRSQGVLSLRNDTTSPATLTVRALDGAVVDPIDGVVVAAGARIDVPVPFVAGAASGLQGIEATLVAGAETRRAEARVLVRPLLPYTTDWSGVVVDGTGAATLPADFAPDGFTARVTVHRSVHADLLPAVRALIGYPHGCGEQITSAAFGVLACRALLPTLDPAYPTVVVDDMLRTAVARLCALRGGSGGVAYWHGGSDDSYLSTYVLEFLLAARAAGIAVPDADVTGLTDAVARLLANDRNATDADGRVASRRTAAVAALAAAGRPIAGWASTFAGMPLSVDARAFLALAFARAGQRDAAIEQLDRLDADLAQDGAVVAFGDSLATRERIEAIALRVRLAVRPNDPRIASDVLRLQQVVRRPGRLSTPTTAQVLLALGQAFDAANAVPAATSVDVQIGETTLTLRPGETTTLPAGPGAELAFRGDGRAFVVVETAGFRELPVASGPQLARTPTWTFVDVAGKPVEELRRGEIYDVVLTFPAAAMGAHQLATVVLPGGCEWEPVSRWKAENDDVAVASVNVRDDRALLFRTAANKGGTFRARMRAVFPGTVAAGGLVVEELYEPTSATRFAGPAQIVVRG